MLSQKPKNIQIVVLSLLTFSLFVIMDSIAKYLATYWADKGVRSNALSPGGVYNGHNEEFVQRISSLIPLGRMANVDDYESAVQFLCSDASAYMTGQNIVIDGGRSIL